jgi:hypothetical protein
VNNPRWLDVVRHHVRGFRAPFLLVLQHHDIKSTTRVAAPVTLPLAGDVDVLAPRLVIEGREHRVRVLDMSAVPLRLIGETVAPASAEADAILNAIDVILHGYAVGRGA